MSDLTKILADILSKTKPDIEEIKQILDDDKAYRQRERFKSAALDFNYSWYNYNITDKKSVVELAAENDIEVFETLFDYIFNSEDIQQEIKHQVFMQAFKAALNLNSSDVFSFLLRYEKYLNQTNLFKFDQVSMKYNKKDYNLVVTSQANLLDYGLIIASLKSPAAMVEEYVKTLLLFGANYEQIVEKTEANLNPKPQTVKHSIDDLITMYSNLDAVKKLFKLAKEWNKLLEICKSQDNFVLMRQLCKILKLDMDFLIKKLERTVQDAIDQSHEYNAEENKELDQEVVAPLQDNHLEVAKDYRFLIILFKNLTLLLQPSGLDNSYEKYYTELQMIGGHFMAYNLEYPAEHSVFKSQQELDNFFNNSFINPLIKGALYEDSMKAMSNFASEEPSSPRPVRVSDNPYSFTSKPTSHLPGSIPPTEDHPSNQQAERKVL